ncbi:uncharacterized protein SPSC_03615 [Sporisorium scitamineum]|uniref:Caffeine-induced death protein 2 n=1 Tax=Sporisorium scitamineum TaxID=49012 RepID=A0A0F7S360_9BASI|nr:uncharacterized protein SPSC_03615 [Sporisorium scitamineum]CDW96746.1 hypothetical protein [Sporisorium scitamineum]
MSTWVSPSMSRFNRGSSSSPPSHDDISSAGPSAFAPQYEPVQLGSSSVLKPLTPPNVSNLTPSTCLAIGEFKELLRQYRQLDDGITTRLNRTFARSRALGQSTSPSLLSSSGMTSASSADLGTSTYATPAPGACAAFWRELVDVWIGREEAVRFCIKVADQHSNPSPPPSSARSSTDQLLDADFHPSSSRPATEQRWSRAENSAETLARQLHNELKVESIIRARSLDAFKSRCRFFTPSPPPGPEGDRERAMWLGQPTPAAQASAQGVVRP